MSKKTRYAVAIGLLVVIAAGFTLFNSQSNITAGSTCETKGITKSKKTQIFKTRFMEIKLLSIDNFSPMGGGIVRSIKFWRDEFFLLNV